jgi:dolichol-phosphate mannosyltransferase
MRSSVARSRRPKKGKPSVSVVVLAFNEEGNLEPAVETIRRALNGRLSKQEIIIVNDGSCDDTGAVAERIAGEDPHVRVIHNSHNLGCGDAFMRGVEAATCEYVWLMPGDGEISDSSLDTIVSHIGTADMVIPYVANFNMRPLTRQIVSWGYTSLLNTVFLKRLRYYNGPCVIRSDLVRSAPMVNSYGFTFMAPILLRLISGGHDYVQVGIRLQPRQYGRTSFCTLRSIMSAFKIVPWLFWDIHVRRRRSVAPPDCGRRTTT